MAQEPVREPGRPSISIHGVRVPTLVYGTAWKEERTAPLVASALSAGFRAIDTANQRRHYYEAAVGEAVREALRSGTIRRDELFLQTKFTYAEGQDHRLPYDAMAPVATQVEQSMTSSLEHLGVVSLDAYLLHGPSTYPGLGAADREAWGAMEQLQRKGRTRLIGVSNILASQLEELWSLATVKPAIVQNRTFTRPEADRAVRDFCSGHGLAYEGFSLLTAHRGLLTHPLVVAIARRLSKTAAQVVLRYCLHEGMVVLTGTTSAAHMRDDLALQDFELASDDLRSLRELLG